jgi:hypothetical protein
MKSQQKVLEEIERFLTFQLEHADRHNLPSFPISVDKASQLSNSILEVRKSDPHQLSDKSWYLQEIQLLRQELTCNVEKNGQGLLEEMGTFLNFQLQHCTRHKLPSFPVTVEKATRFVKNILQVRYFYQANYNEWLLQEIRSLRQELDDLKKRL